jgi:hypothetical protein
MSESDTVCGMQPWHHQAPPVLYKYLPPERFHVLTDCRVRFTQRKVFSDDHELRPDYATFGTETEIREFAQSINFDLNRGSHLGLTPEGLVLRIASDPRMQQIAIDTLQRSITVRDQLGIFCLTEAADNEQMWKEYAKDDSGLVIGFDTTHAGFAQLKEPGILGKVAYSDQPIGSAIATFTKERAPEALFFKRTHYAFEREWRTVRLLKRCQQATEDIYLSPFDPASVREIVIRSGCVVERELRDLCSKNEKYGHVIITTQK